MCWSTKRFVLQNIEKAFTETYTCKYTKTATEPVKKALRRFFYSTGHSVECIGDPEGFLYGIETPDKEEQDE